MLWLFQVRMPQNSPPFNLTFTLSSAVDWRLISCQPESNINFCGSPGNPIHAAQTKHWQMLLLSLWLINPRPHPTQDWTPARKLQFPEALADLSLMVQKQLAPVKWCWGPGRLCFHSVVPACRAPGESYSCFFINYTWSQLSKSNLYLPKLPLKWTQRKSGSCRAKIKHIQPKMKISSTNNLTYVFWMDINDSLLKQFLIF